MSSSLITHIVLFKYDPAITWSDFQAHIDSFTALKTKCLRNGKPYMRSLKMGINTSWEPFSKGMTHGFVLEFDSADDLDYYLVRDTVHIEFSRRAKPYVLDSVVVDIQDGLLLGPKRPHPQLVSAAADPDVYLGSCHCRKIEWTARLHKAEHILCHCATCQKLGGGPYSCNQIIARDHLVIVNGTPQVYTYQGASGKDVRCFFCPTCTSHVYHHQDAMPDKVIVRTLLLEGGKEMPATGEIFAEGRLQWVRDLNDSMPTPETRSERSGGNTSS